MTERDFALQIIRRLREAGYEAYFAGGCVRDELLGQVPADYDVATAARPEQVTRLFRRTIQVGASFGVVEVLGPRQADGSYVKTQVATFRSDGVYTDGRRPDQVTYASAEADAQRRDFTINGMFLDPLTDQVLDFVGGQADLKQGILRAIGEPEARIEEDKLRMLRAVRMAARFELAIDPKTWAAVQWHAAGILVVSAERIAEELRKMLVHSRRRRAVELLYTSGLLAHILPPLADQADRVPTSFEATLSKLAQLEGVTWPQPGPVTVPMALAALLGSLEQPQIEPLLDHLRLANAEKDRTYWLLTEADRLLSAEQLPASQLYPLLVHPGIGELLALSRARAAIINLGYHEFEYVEKLLRSKSRAELEPPPLLTGNDLLRHGLRPGPQFKHLLQRVREAQLDQQVQTPHQAMELVLRLLADLAET